MDTLIENPTLRHSETLPNTLASLQRMLTLAELAVQAYKHTPLAETLSYYMTLQVDHCRPLLQELISELSNYRHALSTTMFKLIRQYIWSGVGEGYTASRLNSKLRECHSTFASCILALGRWAIICCSMSASTDLEDCIVLHGLSWTSDRG